MLVDNYVKPILQLNLITLMNNYVKLVINVTCTIELKINVSWKKTLLE